MAEKTKVTDRPVEETGLPGEEEVLRNEYDLMEGLLEAAEYKNDEDLQKKVEIRRKDKFLFAFTVRPLSEEDIRNARKKATKTKKNPAGRNLPDIEVDTDVSALRSWKIYLATIEPDRSEIWDNMALKKKFNAMQGYELVDVLLTGGEKSAVIELIDEISGYDLDLTDYAKN